MPWASLRFWFCRLKIKIQECKEYISVELTWEIVEKKKKQEDTGSADGHVHEEGLCVEALVELHDLDSLVEDGVDEHVAHGIPREIIINNIFVLMLPVCFNSNTPETNWNKVLSVLAEGG